MIESEITNPIWILHFDIECLSRNSVRSLQEAEGISQNKYIWFDLLFSLFYLRQIDCFDAYNFSNAWTHEDIRSTVTHHHPDNNSVKSNII